MEKEVGVAKYFNLWRVAGQEGKMVRISVGQRPGHLLNPG